MLTPYLRTRYILRHNNDNGMSDLEIQFNSEALIAAGSETTATCMSGTMYYLAKNPDIRRIATSEVRSRFSSEDEITMKSTMDLPYLQACIEEALRLFPPAIVSPTRVSPGDFVAGYYLPKNVSSLLI
jgi:cytochrome P450